MEFEQVIETQKTKLAVVAPIETETPVVLTDRDIPVGMPLTNQLDKMTADQGAWAIRNGDAWIAYLQASAGEVVGYPKVKDIEVSPAEQWQAVCEVLDRVWHAMVAESSGETLEPNQYAEWVDTLKWSLAVIPNGYERHAAIIQNDLDYWLGVIENGKRKGKRK